MPSDALEIPASYGEILTELKQRVRVAQLRAQRRVNTELIGLYWSIGNTILQQQAAEGWGTKIVERLSNDLRREFPEMTGLSRSNLMYMRSFATAWPAEVVQQPAGQLPWAHIMVLLDKLDSRDDRDWYAAEALEHGWSRAVLQHQIMNQLRRRIGAAPTNFNTQLESTDSELAQQLAKDPYVFDFLGLGRGVAERDLEQAIMDRLVDTLRELGEGFAFVDRQKHFDVGGEDFYLDLLFFHTVQLRYVVIELKIGKFVPDYAGQLGFYVALVDDRLRQPSHAPTVGILLCTDRNEAVVRYALHGTNQPVAVSTYTYESLPPEEQQALPTAGQLAHALEGLTDGGVDPA